MFLWICSERIREYGEETYLGKWKFFWSLKLSGKKKKNSEARNCRESLWENGMWGMEGNTDQCSLVWRSVMYKCVRFSQLDVNAPKSTEISYYFKIFRLFFSVFWAYWERERERERENWVKERLNRSEKGRKRQKNWGRGRLNKRREKNKIPIYIML